MNLRQRLGSNRPGGQAAPNPLATARAVEAEPEPAPEPQPEAPAARTLFGRLAAFWRRP